jgi:uncharacterized protein YggE
LRARVPIVVALTSVLAGCGGAGDERTLTVFGTGSVETVPTRVEFQFTVEARGGTATTALAKMAAEASRLNSALTVSAGISRRNLQTTNLSVDPVRTRTGEITAYNATTTVTAEIRGIARAGRAVDAAVSAGATVQGPTLLPAQEDRLYERALNRALARAHEKATQLAKTAGARLGRLRAAVEGGAASPVAGPTAEAASARILPGTTTIEATVTATYELR